MRFGLYGSAPDVISIDLANSLLFTAFAVTWTGARVFDHRKPLPVLLFGGYRINGFYGVSSCSQNARFIGLFMIAGINPSPRSTETNVSTM